jgi:MFS family permease
VAGSTSYGPWIVAAVLLALGTVIVYPTLLAAIGDVAHPIWRARAVGVCRLWRDAGFAAGALVADLIADLWASPARFGSWPRAHRQVRTGRCRSHVRDPRRSSAGR